jgi:hypothetical protein
MKFLIVALFFVFGCNDIPEKLKANSRLAQGIVWRILGAQGVLPRVVWRYSDCDGPKGQKGIIVGQGSCLAGAYYNSTIDLVVPQKRITETAFSHEHIHAWMWSDAGVEDPNHQASAWSYLPAKLDQAIAARPDIDIVFDQDAF